MHKPKRREPEPYMSPDAGLSGRINLAIGYMGIREVDAALDWNIASGLGMVAETERETHRQLALTALHEFFDEARNEVGPKGAVAKP